MTPCGTCGRMLDWSAETCPGCGRNIKKHGHESMGFWQAVVGLAVLVALWMYFT